MPEPEPVRAPQDSLGKLFLRFLRFGALAWGGPVAQIDMIRQELVAQEKWITPGHFKRLLAIYQVLPGPEAHELCVHFGMVARGRWGGVVAGLGFMLPGFVLMFLLSWLYVTAGLTNAVIAAIFVGIQPAVVALIVRAVHRIGGHSLTDAPLWAIGILAAAGEALGVSFWIALPLAGLGYVVGAARRWAWAAVLGGIFAVALWQSSPVIAGRVPLLPRTETAIATDTRQTGQASPAALFGSGLRAGLLTFGGAYTAIPFLKNDAVERGRWMSERDFIDGVALSGVLPAPLIIFSTFVGYFGGGPLGALSITLGIFLPAFGFSLLFFRQLESAMANPLLKHFLEGVTAAVVGLIAVTAAKLAFTTLTNPAAGAIFAIALAVAWRWKSRWAVPAIILGAGAAGWLFPGN
ncbi:MAG: chromate efflux transporter [Opitutaceae bacterium]|nr:chromate efflux transporter [Opitutaceae bacterium]